MSSTQPLRLEGHVDSSEAIRLRREIARLEQELAEARAEAAKYKAEGARAARAVKNLERVTEPLYKALQMIHGEIEAADIESDEGDLPASGARGNRSIWQERIAKATPSEARILQVMLDGGGEMSLNQIRNAAATHGNTSTYLNRLAARNWVSRVGSGTWALKG